MGIDSEYKVGNDIYWIDISYSGATLTRLRNGSLESENMSWISFDFPFGEKPIIEHDDNMREHLVSLGADKLADLIIGLLKNAKEDIDLDEIEED